MRKKYFICDAQNKLGLQAIKSVLEKIKSSEFYFTPVMLGEKRPSLLVELNDAVEKNIEVSELLFWTFKTEAEDSDVYAININLSIYFDTSKKNPVLFCTASFLSEDMSKTCYASEAFELPKELQEYLAPFKSVYDSINECFEEKVSEDTDLYNYFTKEDTVKWYEKILLKLLEV